MGCDVVKKFSTKYDAARSWSCISCRAFPVHNVTKVYKACIVQKLYKGVKDVMNLLFLVCGHGSVTVVGRLF